MRTQTLKNREYFKETQERTGRVRATMTVVGKPNKWATQRAALRNACCAFTDEEISLYECMALSGWENR